MFMDTCTVCRICRTSKFVYAVGEVMFTGSVVIAGVDRDEGRSLQVQATTDLENETVLFELVEVTNGQESFVVLNSSGYLIIRPLANESFYIDVSFLVCLCSYV